MTPFISLVAGKISLTFVTVLKKYSRSFFMDSENSK